MATIYGLAISARATLDMHSLNNEGGEGNQIQTRMVDVMGGNGRLYQVNAISGDMIKHIQAEHLFRLAQTAEQPMCAACAKFDANRISGDDSFLKRVATNKYTNVQTVDDLLHTCVIDDLEGILITAGSRSVPRKSVVEFGWVVGIPEQVRTEQYFHVKYNPQARNKEEAEASGEPVAEKGSNLGQAIFHRPASSGNYALVANVEAARIGYNDISQQYALDEEARTMRLRLLLQSLIYTFVQPNGAMLNTQMPHLVNVEGVITVSSAILPAPTISPINEGYKEQIKKVVANLNGLPRESLPGVPQEEEAVTSYPFASLAEFTEIMTRLTREAVPYRFVTR
jgi:CRISPR-associated protein Cst2